MRSDPFIADAGLEWFRSTLQRLLAELGDWHLRPPADYRCPALLEAARVGGVTWQDVVRLAIGSPKSSGELRALIERLFNDDNFRSLTSHAPVCANEAAWIDGIIDRTVARARRDGLFCARATAAYLEAASSHENTRFATRRR